MKLSKYDILSNAKLSFTASFKCDKKQIIHFNEYEYTPINGSWTVMTCPKPYAEAKIELSKLMMLIDNHAKTEWNNSLYVNISFDENISKIYHINPLKLILSFEEYYLYDLFPDRKNRVGSRSVSGLIKPGVNKDNLTNTLENDSNIYAIDLSHKGINVIQYRYIGGVDYQKKYQEISMIIDKWIINTYTTIENPEYTQEEIKRLSMLSQENSIDDIFVSYNSFSEKYKNINLLVDLQDINGYENVYWPSIKDRLKDLIKSTSMSEQLSLTINYDSDSGKLQIKDSNLYGVSGLADIELIDCSISGDVSNISLYYCCVNNTNANFCNFFTGCTVSKSILNNCYIADNVKISNSVIQGDSTIVNGELSKCSIAQGAKYTKYTKLKDCINDGFKI